MMGNMQSILNTNYINVSTQHRMMVTLNHSRLINLLIIMRKLNQVLCDGQCFNYYLLHCDLGAGSFKIYCKIIKIYCYREYIYEVNVLKSILFCVMHSVHSPSDFTLKYKVLKQTDNALLKQNTNQSTKNSNYLVINMIVRLVMLKNGCTVRR